MLNERVIKVLNENLWDVATTSADGMPNVVPVGFKCITEEGQLAFANVFLETTLKNLAENGGRIAISAYNAKTMEGYQIKGIARTTSEGPAVETFRGMCKALFKNPDACKGAVIIDIEKVIVTTPGKDNKKEI